MKVSAEAISDQESCLYFENPNEVGNEQILMASKLYTQYVQPEQDLLAFSSDELNNTIANFDSAR